MCQLFPLPCHPAAGERLRELGGWMLEPGDSSSLGKRAWPPSTLEQGSFLVFWWWLGVTWCNHLTLVAEPDHLWDRPIGDIRDVNAFFGGINRCLSDCEYAVGTACAEFWSGHWFSRHMDTKGRDVDGGMAQGQVRWTSHTASPWMQRNCIPETSIGA